MAVEEIGTSDCRPGENYMHALMIVCFTRLNYKQNYKGPFYFIPKSL